MARDGRVPGAIKVGRRWLFPPDVTEILPVYDGDATDGWSTEPNARPRASAARRSSIAAIRGH
jgi:hypothetical protein